MNILKEEVSALLDRALQEVLGISSSGETIEGLQTPRNDRFGDYAFPVFRLAKELGKNPNTIASDLSRAVNDSIEDGRVIQSVSNDGGFVNFALNPITLADVVLKEISAAGVNYGRNNDGEGKLVIVEFSSPNYGKPMHIGHIRSTIVGDSLSNILVFNGYKVHRMNYPGDTGTHIAQLITAIELWKAQESLEVDSDRVMLDLYVRFQKLVEFQKAFKVKKTLDDTARQVLRNLEEGHDEHVRLWKLIGDLSLETFQRIYNLLDVRFDEIEGQSQFTYKGKEIVQAALERDKLIMIAAEEANAPDAFGVDLESYDLSNMVVLRGDGTALYQTQDLGAAVSRHERFGFKKMLYVVGTEQTLYFRQLFATLESFGYECAQNCQHVGSGLLHMEDEKMSSRAGNVVFLEEVLGKAINLARERIAESDFSAAEIDELSKSVGIGAVKHMVLSVEPHRDINFSWEAALDLHGNSAPYIQYAVARASRLLLDGNHNGQYNPKELTEPHEIALVRQLSRFPDIVAKSAAGLKPNFIAHYVNDVAAAFNSFYQSHKTDSRYRILGTPEQNSRLALVSAAKTTMVNGLSLLGIRAPDKM